MESRQYLEEHRLNRLLTEAMRAGIDAADEQSPVRRTGIELSRTGFTPRSAGQMVLWDPVTYAPPPPVEDGTPPPLDLSAVGERIARSEINIRELRENVADVLSRKDQASVGEVLEAHPAKQGLGSVVGLMELALRHGIPGSGIESLKWTGLDGRERSATVNQLFFVKDKIDELTRIY